MLFSIHQFLVHGIHGIATKNTRHCNASCHMMIELRHPSKIISDARVELGIAQDRIRQRKHKKTLKKIRQELNRILDS